jgi:hypothetical protein
LRKTPQKFTKNKEVVRSLQRQCIEKHLKAKLGDLRYFGLPASTLEDARTWSDIFGEFTAVERGEPAREWELQHELELQAFKTNLFDKLRLLRGDIDDVIRKGRDQFRNRPRFPFDVVSLDYGGGLFYRDSKGDYPRLNALAALIQRQARAQYDFVLLVSCNLDQVDRGEVLRTIDNLRTELVRYGSAAEAVLEAYRNHPSEEPRLKLYLPYFVNLEGAKNHYNCETEEVIFYRGNSGVGMMAFRFYLVFDKRTVSLRQPKERLSQIINQPMIEICQGLANRTNHGLPNLHATDATSAKS